MGGRGGTHGLGRGHPLRDSSTLFMIMALIRWRVIFMGHSLQGRAGLGEEEGGGGGRRGRTARVRGGGGGGKKKWGTRIVRVHPGLAH